MPIHKHLRQKAVLISSEEEWESFTDYVWRKFGPEGRLRKGLALGELRERGTNLLPEFVFSGTGFG
jgi:hypothetical protein